MYIYKILLGNFYWWGNEWFAFMLFYIIQHFNEYIIWVSQICFKFAHISHRPISPHECNINLQKPQRWKKITKIKFSSSKQEHLMGTIGAKGKSMKTRHTREETGALQGANNPGFWQGWRWNSNGRSLCDNPIKLALLWQTARVITSDLAMNSNKR